MIIPAFPRPKYLLPLLLATSVLFSFALMSANFVFMNPIFKCQTQQMDQHGQPKIIQVTEIQACKMNNCYIDNSFTAVPAMGLICQSEQTRSIMQTSIFVGSIIGKFGIAPLSDNKGRKLSIIISFLCLILGTSTIIFGVHLKNWFIATIGLVGNGMFYGGMQIIIYSITAQYWQQKKRPSLYIWYCAMWGLAEMLFLPIYYFMPGWNSFLIYVILIPGIIVFVMLMIFYKESPAFYLYTLKDINKFNDSIQAIAKLPKQDAQKIKQLGAAYLQSTKQQAGIKQNKNISNTDISFKTSFNKLLKNKKYLIPCLCLAISQSGLNIFYFATQGTMERTGYNFGVSMFLAGLHQFVGYMVISMLVHLLPIRPCLYITIIVSSLMGISFMYSLSPLVQSICLSCLRLCSVLCYSLYTQLQTRIFPVWIMSTAMGVMQTLCQLSIFFMPYFIIKMNDMGMHPLIGCSGLFVLLGIGGVWGISILMGKQDGDGGQMVVQLQLKEQ